MIRHRGAKLSRKEKKKKHLYGEGEEDEEEEGEGDPPPPVSALAQFRHFFAQGDRTIETDGAACRHRRRRRRNLLHSFFSSFVRQLVNLSLHVSCLRKPPSVVRGMHWITQKNACIYMCVCVCMKVRLVGGGALQGKKERNVSSLLGVCCKVGSAGRDGHSVILDCGGEGLMAGEGSL